MKTLDYSLMTLQLVGLWRPVHWPSGLKSKLYRIYSCFIIFIVVSFFLALLVELVSSVDDLETIVSNSFLVVTLLTDCGKATNLLIKRDEIIKLTKVLQRDPCQPKSEKEFDIQRKYDKMARFNSLRFITLSAFTVLSITLRSWVEDIPHRSLPFNVWLPFESQNSFLCYCIAYSHQMLGVCISCGIAVSFDTFVAALMLQVCAQLNILKHRFIEIPRILSGITRESRNLDQSNLFILNAESQLLSHRVQHHLEIFKFAEKLNDLFGLMILIQYSASTLIICACMLEISQMSVFEPLFTVLFIYIAEISVQILMYCFYGGEVTIESINLCDAVYEMDWTVLSLGSKRSLLTIMTRTSRPITFTSGRILTMNLESWKGLIKLSYSTFNVLQSTHQR